MAALERYFLEKPDLVMLDLVMKGMYGLDVLTKLRELDPGGARHRRVGRHPDVVAGAGRGGGRGRLHQQAGRAERVLSAGAQRARRAAHHETDRLQEDALIELLNIGFGRAAASLSELTGHRVLLEVPEVTIHPIDEVSRVARARHPTDVASVHQISPARSPATRC